MLNEHRLSVNTYKAFYGTSLYPILVDQYSIHDLQGLLLSPQSFRDGYSFECCSSCYDRLMPSKIKDTGTKPPKHAIANGFAIGHIPSILFIDGKTDPRQTGLENKHISDIMCTAIARQQRYRFIFAFMGSAHQSMMGQFSFFEMDQRHI